MLYNLASDHKLQCDTVTLALQNGQKTEPDVFFITEDGSKIFTHRILLSMYSSTFSSILTDFRPSEMPGVSLPGANPCDLLNLFKILSDGMVFSTDSEALLKVGRVAKLLGIVLEGMQFGKRKPKISLKEEKKKDDLLSSSLEENQDNIYTSTEDLMENEEIGNNAAIKSETIDSDDREHRPSNKTISKEERTCNECEKEFPTRQSLERHMMIHTGEKPFKCIVCEKAFNRPSRAKQCKLTHTGELPAAPTHKCTECDKEFTTKQTLVRHTMAIHTGERPFRCDECGKGFITVSLMKQHRQVHDKTKPFECHCGQKFSLKQSLKKHESKFHNSAE